MVTTNVLPVIFNLPFGQPGLAGGPGVAGWLIGRPSRPAALSAYSMVTSSVMLLGLRGVPELASGAVIAGPIILPGSIAGIVDSHVAPGYGKVIPAVSAGRLIRGVVPHGAVSGMFMPPVGIPEPTCC